MGKSTEIAWTDHTWNPWQGCTPVSTGCDHCYMARSKRRFGHDPWTVTRSAQRTFAAPLRWRDGRVFVCSWSDFFHERVRSSWREEAWSVIRQTPRLTYQILTKRPERILDCLPGDWGDGWPHVWIGVTAEDQARLDERWPILERSPAVVRFISLEPLLGQVTLRDVGGRPLRPDWVIVGGESGPGFRPIHPDWVTAIRDECVPRSIPFFFKQWSATRPAADCMLNGVSWRQFP